MFVESCRKTLRSTAFMPRIRSMIESTLQALAWLSSCWLNHMEFDKDNSHLLQLIFECARNSKRVNLNLA